jgi:sugar lactone lactonase YvrE
MRVRTAAAVVVGFFVAIPSALFAQSILTVAGGGTDDGRPATLAALSGPSGMAVDAAGNLFIADGCNNRIRRVAAGSGIITTVAGNGSGGFSGDGAAATAAQLQCPYGVALDSAGNLYIADSANNRIRKVAAGSGIITTVAGNGSVNGGFSGDGGAATAAQLEGPYGVALDSAGNLYIADSANNRIRKVAAGSGIITTVAGSAFSGFSGDGGAATAAGLSDPLGVALDSAGNLYIAHAYRIRKVATGNGIITTVAGNGSQGFSGDGGAATAAALYPSGIAVDAAGNVYAADSGSNRIREVAAGSAIITTIAGNGSQGFSGDGGAATAAGLFSPGGVALDARGNLYIAEAGSNHIRKVATGSGIITTVAGMGFYLFGGFSGDGGPATAAELSGPEGVALDSVGNLYIADSGNYRIRKVAAGSGIIMTVAGNGSRGFSGDGAAATAAGLSDPSSVALDPVGDLYIADRDNNRIRKVAAGSGIITTVAGSEPGVLSDGVPATSARLGFPLGVAVDSAGNLYIAEDTRIRTVAAGSGIITTVAGNFGSPGFSGDGGAATGAQLTYPEGVALDSAGNLYIADTDNDRIRKVTAGSGIITTVAGIGSPGFSGDGGAATAAQIGPPAGVALDSAGNLYIADYFNHRIRKVTAVSGIITTVAGNGSRGSSGDGGAATAAQIARPAGVALDSAGNLYIADTDNDRIRKVTAGSGIITTVAGNGSYGFGGDGGVATVAGLSFPCGVALDTAGNFYIADRDSNRVRAVFACVTVPRLELTVPSDGVHGVSSSAKLAWKPVQGAFSYDVYLDKTNPPQKSVASDISAISYPASNLELGATYYWKIVAKGDRFCPSPSTASSEVRSFTTAEGCGPASFN